MLKSVGGLFYNSNATPSFKGDYAIYGKYFLSEKMAVRAGLGLNLGTEANSYTPVETSDTDKPAGATNTTFGFALNGGLEWRHTISPKFQWYYGADLLLGLRTESTTAEVDGKEQASIPGNLGGGSVSKSTNFNFGLMGVLGAEYFVKQNFSIGAEFGYGLWLTTQSSKDAKAKDNGEFDKWEKSPYSTTEFNLNKIAGAINLTIYF
jgi:hypothetical protein